MICVLRVASYILFCKCCLLSVATCKIVLDMTLICTPSEIISNGVCGIWLVNSKQVSYMIRMLCLCNWNVLL